MVAKAELKLGLVNYQFEIEEKEEIETLHKIIVLTNPRRKCSVIAQSGSIDLRHWTAPFIVLILDILCTLLSIVMS